MKKAAFLLALLLLSAFLAGGQTPVIGTGIATVDTAGEGYFLAFYVHATATATGVIVAADDVRASQFVLPFRAVINRILTDVTTGGGASSLYGVGIYSADGQTLLTETGALDADTVARNETTVTEVTFEPGVYWFAWTSDSGTLQMRRGSTAMSNSLLSFASSKRSVLAGNSPISPGVLPASLGALTTGTTTSPPLAFFFKE